MKRSLVVLAAIMLVTMSLVAATAQQGQGPGGGRRGGRGRMMGGLGLLRNPAVQTELKMTQAQIDKVDVKQQEVRGQLQELAQNGGDFQNMSAEDRAKLMAKFQGIQHKAVADILDSTQMHRFDQLELQQQGPPALLRPEVASKLGLSETQKTTLHEIMTKTASERESAMAGKSRQDMTTEDREKIRAIEKSSHERMLAVLTDSQKTAWHSMLGETFHFTPGGGRGRHAADA